MLCIQHAHFYLDVYSKTQSFMSAITLLGTPAEVYQFGSMYWLIVLAFFLVIPATNYLYMPIFYQLQVTSAYEVQPNYCNANCPMTAIANPLSFIRHCSTLKSVSTNLSAAWGRQHSRFRWLVYSILDTFPIQIWGINQRK